MHDQRSRDRKLREESRIRASLKPRGRMGGLEIVFRHSGQAWPLLVCAGICKNRAAAVSTRHGGMQSVSDASWSDGVGCLYSAATEKLVLLKVQAWHNLTSQCRHRAKRHWLDLLAQIELANTASSVRLGLLPGAAWCFAHGSEPR